MLYCHDWQRVIEYFDRLLTPASTGWDCCGVENERITWYRYLHYYHSKLAVPIVTTDEVNR
jgi:hypothetical protein